MLKNKKLLILAILLANMLLTNCECQKKSEGSEKQDSNSRKDQKPIKKNEDLIIKEKEQLKLKENQLIAILKKQYKATSWQEYEKEFNAAKHNPNELLKLTDDVNYYENILMMWVKQGLKNIPRISLTHLCIFLDSIEGININLRAPGEDLETILEFNKKYFISKADPAITAHLELCQNLRKQLDLEKGEK